MLGWASVAKALDLLEAETPTSFTTLTAVITWTTAPPENLFTPPPPVMQPQNFSPMLISWLYQLPSEGAVLIGADVKSLSEFKFEYTVGQTPWTVESVPVKETPTEGGLHE
jgi:hypothetical protein